MINLWAVVVCGILAMAIGYVWYGPLFGKLWLKACNATALDLEKRKEMEKNAQKLYVIQFAMALFQAYILAYTPAAWFLIWLAFVVPTVASTSMWNNDSSKVKWTKFLLQSGYFFVMFLVFALVLGAWR